MTKDTIHRSDDGEWHFNLEEPPIPAYQPGTAEKNQPRAARAYRREQQRELNYYVRLPSLFQSVVVDAGLI
jgi:hypothetical protein